MNGSVIQHRSIVHFRAAFIIDADPAALVFGGTVMDLAVVYVDIMLAVIVTAVSYDGDQVDRAAVIFAFTFVEFDIFERQLRSVIVAYASA